METASASPIRDMSLEALKRPALTAARSCASLTSFTCEWQPLSPSTTRCCTSKPSTRYPAWASSMASGSPTYPRPTIPNRTSRRSALSINSCAMLIRSSRVELQHGLDHGVLLRRGQLGKHRERDHFRGGGFGHRDAAALVSQGSEAGLEV